MMYNLITLDKHSDVFLQECNISWETQSQQLLTTRVRTDSTKDVPFEVTTVTPIRNVRLKNLALPLCVCPPVKRGS
jgi:hypothetical protein